MLQEFGYPVIVKHSLDRGTTEPTPRAVHRPPATTRLTPSTGSNIMPRPSKPIAALSFVWLLSVAATRADDAAPARPGVDGIAFFEAKIRPVLVDRCYQCHSAGSEKVKGGLRVDHREGMVKGGDAGPSVVPGKPEESPLIEAIRYGDEALRMPPKTPLTPEQVADFEAWVRMGAPDPRDAAPSDAATPAPKMDVEKARSFWSFRPVADPPPPLVKDASWPKNEVDRFVLAKLEAAGVAPVAEADKTTLLRRATFDLTGLPPAPEEADAFLADESPDAFGKVVERLLASPAYGERWGRHWLDLVRYADTAGCNSDFPVPTAYKYRDYVISAFNRDKPYDRFLREQVAGDLLPGESSETEHERKIATGYLATARRFGSSPTEFHLTLDDAIDNIGKAVLGLSISCARCHDHKFDPIPQADYYALYGILDSSKFAYPGLENARRVRDFVALGSPEEAEGLRKHETEVYDLEVRLRKLNREKNSPQKEGRTTAIIDAEIGEVKGKLKELDAHPPGVAKAYAVAEGTPHDAPLFRKGDPAHPAATVPRGFLQILGGQRLPEAVGPKESGRLELAGWLTDPSNPLTARVMVNRIWQHHFGRGLVATPNDFGARGRPPTHPELLDHLATRFVQDGWSIKAMHRRIMLSRTYQLSAAEDSRAASVDPANELHWRHNRRRLSAEEIRDGMLAVAGTLDRSPPGGPFPLPPESEFRYTQHVQFVAPESFDTRRRTVYQIQQRLRRRRILEVFDGADPNATTPDRPLSTTAIQALYLMNDPFVHERAAELARRLEDASDDEGARIGLAYGLAFNRPATAAEVEAGRAYLSDARPALAEAGLPDEARPRASLESLVRVLLASNEFLFVD
jgi:Protein of unknown function (DUF1553)/Protein of unknown function (DUF1549)/Planctomycete cytochrome C